MLTAASLAHGAGPRTPPEPWEHNRATEQYQPICRCEFDIVLPEDTCGSMRPGWPHDNEGRGELARRGAVSGLGRRERTRRVSTGILVTIALVISLITVAGMTAKAVISQASCSSQPLLVNLAVSFDISPAIQTIARTFNKQNESAAGRCVEVEVTPGQPSAVAAQIDGQVSLHGLAALDAWIPDSTLWVDVARKYPVGARIVQPTGISVAKSPIMLVTSQQVADETGVFAGPPSWGCC